MQDVSVSLTVVVFLALIALLVASVAAPVEIVDTLQNVNPVPLSGAIMVIQEMPNLSFTTYEEEEICRFRFMGVSEWLPRSQRIENDVDLLETRRRLFCGSYLVLFRGVLRAADSGTSRAAGEFRDLRGTHTRARFAYEALKSRLGTVEARQIRGSRGQDGAGGSQWMF